MVHIFWTASTKARICNEATFHKLTKIGEAINWTRLHCGRRRSRCRRGRRRQQQRLGWPKPTYEGWPQTSQPEKRPNAIGGSSNISQVFQYQLF